MSYRCPDCFSGWERHVCRCRSDRLQTLGKLTSFDEWDSNFHLLINYSPSRSSLIFLQDTDQCTYDSTGKKTTIKDEYRKYIEIPRLDQNLDREALRRRIAESFAFGRSSVFHFDNNNFEAEIDQLIENLMIEVPIREILDARNIFGAPKLTLRFSGDCLAFQKMLNGTCVPIGPERKIRDLAREYVRDERYSDAAHALLAVPFHWLLRKEENVLSMLKAMAEELGALPSRISDGYELMYTLQILCDKLSNRHLEEMGFDPRDSNVYIIVSFICYPDVNYFSLPGGKREVAETSLECALRETKEETGIDILEEGIEFRDQPSTLRAQCEWTVLAHLALPIDSFRTYVYFVVNSAPLIPCREFFSTGSCRYGEACIFRHDGDPPSLIALNEKEKGEPLPLSDGWDCKHTGERPSRRWVDDNEPNKACWYYFSNGCNRDPCRFRHTGPKPTQEWMEKHDPRKPCEAFFINRKCSFGDRCNFRHTGDPPTHTSWRASNGRRSTTTHR